MFCFKLITKLLIFFKSRFREKNILHFLINISGAKCQTSFLAEPVLREAVHHPVAEMEADIVQRAA